jgi:myo-inositol-1(or 4)-monophosphatase
MSDDRIDAMLDMAREAGALAQRMRADPAALDTRVKGPMDLVTAADLAVEARLRERILALEPEVAILGEEGGLEGQGRQAWIIDPIDGTVNFARNTPNWAISIARFDGQALTHGIIHAPDLNMTAWARRGGGAYLNDARIRFGTRPEPTPILALGYSPRVPLTEYFTMIEAMQAEGVEYRRYGAATICFLGVVAGWFDGFHESALNLWDAAAGLLLVEEAGGSLRHDPFESFFERPSSVTALSPRFTDPGGIFR